MGARVAKLCVDTNDYEEKRAWKAHPVLEHPKHFPEEIVRNDEEIAQKGYSIVEYYEKEMFHNALDKDMRRLENMRSG